MSDESPTNATGNDSLNMKVALGVLWVLSLLGAAIIGYTIGNGYKAPEVKNETNVLGADSITNPPALPTTAPTAIPETAKQTPKCEKTGYAQKWDYLTEYKVKEKDTLPIIAEAELGNADRVNEILQLNGVGPLVVGSTLYLPPKSIKKSSGNLKLVQGKITQKNSSMWHLSFNEDQKGMGILIPTYWFDTIMNKDTYVVGDCVSVLLDDGNTVFEVTRQ